MELTGLDWLIIVLYFVVTLGIGLGFRNRASASLADYFVSGRSLPWWIAGTSMVATTFAADTPLAVTGLVAANGLAGNWVWWAMALGGMFTVFLYARLWRRAEVMTDVELTELRYSGKAASALRAVRAVYVALIINPIIIGWVTGAMLSVLKVSLFSEPGTIVQIDESGFLDWSIIVGCLLVVGIYCSLSGLWGVAITDVIQFGMAMVGCILLAIVAVNHVGGVTALSTQLNVQFDTATTSGQAFQFLPSFTGENTWMPLHVFLIFLLVQWWATWYPGAEPGGGGYVVQRMAACKDERHAVLATLWYQVAHYCLRPWPWLLVAFASLVMYPELREYAIDQSNETRADLGFAYVLRDLSPVGLRGLMLVTFFAAFMSTISTQMNWGASYLVRDVYQRFINPDASDQQHTAASRWISVLVLIAGGIATLIMKDIDIGEVWKILLALGAGTGAVYMLRWYWWRINAWSEISAMLGSLVYFLVFREVFPQLRSEELILIVALATILTWLVVTFATRPDDKGLLIAFYRKVRPGGPGWGPIASDAQEVDVDQGMLLRCAAAVLAALIIYSVIPLVGAIIFGDWQTVAISSLVAVASAIGLGFVLQKLGWNNVI